MQRCMQYLDIYIYCLYIYVVYLCLMHLYPPRLVVKNETTLQSAEHVTNQEPEKKLHSAQKQASLAKKTLHLQIQGFFKIRVPIHPHHLFPACHCHLALQGELLHFALCGHAGDRGRAAVWGTSTELRTKLRWKVQADQQTFHGHKVGLGSLSCWKFNRAFLLVIWGSWSVQ